MSKDCAVVVFAKAPVAGVAKTRLVPVLGTAGAARLALRMLHETLATAAQAGIGPLELCCTPDAADPALAAAATRFNATLSAQGDGDLGQRMERALARQLAAGRHALLVGTDCPGLNAGHLQQAAQLLHQTPVVLAPVADGGYVLVGLSGMVPRLFTDINWSTATVMTQTRERLAQANMTAAELPPLHDVDEPADLVHVPAGWLA